MTFLEQKGEHGERIVLQKALQLLEIGRTSVHVALVRLDAEGLLMSRGPHCGLCVRTTVSFLAVILRRMEAVCWCPCAA